MTPAYRLAAAPTLGCPADPGQERLGRGAVVPGDGPSIGAERRRERRGVAGDRRESTLHEVGGPGEERLRVAFRDAALGEDVFLQRVEPVVEDGPQGARLGVGGREAFGQPPVHRLEAVQRRFRLGNLHLRRGEPFAFRPLLQPPCEEGLPAAVLAANRLELRPPGRDRRQLFGHHGIERL